MHLCTAGTEGWAFAPTQAWECVCLQGQPCRFGTSGRVVMRRPVRGICNPRMKCTKQRSVFWIPGLVKGSEGGWKLSLEAALRGSVRWTVDFWGAWVCFILRLRRPDLISRYSRGPLSQHLFYLFPSPFLRLPLSASGN